MKINKFFYFLFKIRSSEFIVKRVIINQKILSIFIRLSLESYNNMSLIY